MKTSIYYKYFLMECFKQMRENYKPDVIKCLFIAESPPIPRNNEGVNNCKELRFFYNPYQVKQDYLFKNLMEIIFPAFKGHYKNNFSQKRYYLSKFQRKGFYLMDATEFPINDIQDQKLRNYIIRLSINSIINKLNKILSNKNTPIILIKNNIYNILSNPLRNSGFNVINTSPIPFPSHNNNNQRRFRNLVSNILNNYCK